MNGLAVVIATRNRRANVLRTLARLAALPERPEITVVDDASDDGTASAVRAQFPRVRAVRLRANLGAAARTVGVALARAPLVAFSDDDSWWAPGALARARRHFAAHPRLGLLAGRVLVEPEQRLDPTCAEMARSPLPSAGLPGPSVLGFVCCGAVVRRAAYLAVGGFEPRFRIGGEEALLALDLAAAGWDLCYAADVVAHHEPFPGRSDRGDRHRLTARNALWCAWLRYRPRLALAHTMRTAAAAIADRDVRAGLTAALAGLPWVWKERRPVPAHLDRALRACRSLPAG